VGRAAALGRSALCVDRMGRGGRKARSGFLGLNRVSGLRGSEDPNACVDAAGLNEAGQDRLRIFDAWAECAQSKIRALRDFGYRSAEAR